MKLLLWDLYVNDVLTKDIVLDCPETHTTMTGILAYSSITSIKLNEGFTSLAQTAFTECTALSFIDLPSTIVSVANAFRGNAALTLICRAIAPPSLTSTTLMNISVIYVPDESVGAYQAATNWSTFAAKIKPLSEYVES